MSDSPVSILFDINGNEISVRDGDNISGSTPGLMIAGSDGSDARLITVTTDGYVVVSGSIDQGSPASAANAWMTKITDGTNTVGISDVGGAKALKVDVIQTVGSGASSSFGSSFPATGTASGFNDGTNMQAARVFDADSGGGTQYVLGTILRKSASGGSVEAGTATDPLRIDPTGSTTQPVSGTVTANQGGSWTVASTQSGTWTVQPGNTANTTPWLMTINQGSNSASVTASNALKVDGSAVTQPVSGTLTVSQGTAANLNATVVQSTASNLRAQTASEGSTGATAPSIANLSGGSVTTSAPTYTNGQMSALSLTTAGLLRVDGSGTTQPVSGTITANAGTGTFTVSGTVAATQSGTWTVQPGNTANTTPWLTTISQGGNSATVTGSNALKVDGSAVTQPISGTITANIGTSGSLALDATIAKLTIAQGTALGTNTQALMGGSVSTAAPSYSNGNINPLSLTTAGALRIDGSATTQPVSGTITANAGTGNFTVVQSTASNLNATVLQGNAGSAAQSWFTKLSDGTDTVGISTVGGAKALKVDVIQSVGGGSGGTSSNFGSAVPSAGTAAGFSDGTNMQLGRVFDADTGAGTQYIVGVGLRKSASGGSVELGTSTDPIRIDPTGTTAQPITDNGGSITVDGTIAATQSGTWTVQPGNTANTTPWLTTISQGGNAATVTASNALKVDGSAVTQPISGTITANIGTSGSLALDATLAKLTVAQGASLGTNTQALIGGSVTTAAPTYTTGQISPLSLDTSGALRVTGSISATNPSVSTNNAAIPSSATQVGGSDGTNLRPISVDSSGKQIVIPSNNVSTGNSSTTPLGSSAVFTGTFEEVKDYAAVTVFVVADQNSATNGLEIQWSTAGSVSDDTDTYSVFANNGQYFSFGPEARYFRVKYTNGSSAQSTFKLQTIYHYHNVKPSSHRITDTITDENDAELVKAVLTGKATNGSFVNINATNSGNLSIDGYVSATQSGTWTVQPGNTANTTPWLIRPSDGTNSAAIKAASTPAATTDPALVVAISPNTSNLTLTMQGPIADNAGFTDGTTRVSPVGFIYDDVAGTALTENDVAAARIDSKRAIVQVIEDGTTRGRYSAVKAASTAAVAADPALVVSVSPNTTVRDSDSLGQAQYNFPAGFVRTTDEPHQVFYDPFDSALDTTNRWNAPVSSGGGVAAAISGGVLTLGSGTTINGYSHLSTQASFVPTVPGWLGYSFAISIESAVGTNAHRFWGAGTAPGTPSTTTPLTDAFGFELDTSGKLYAVVYNNGTRTVVQDLSSATGNGTQPSDANYHRYIVYYRTDRTYWYIDSLATPVATSSFQSPAVQTLPLRMSAIAHSSAPASSRVITCTGLAVWDSAKNNNTLSDGSFHWRKATVKAASTAAAATDTALVVGLSPNSSLPVDTYTVITTTTASSGNTTIVTPTSGKRIRLHYIIMNADGANAADVTAYVRFTTSGTALYKVCLKAGAMFARNIGAGRRYIQGGINEALVVNLSAAQTVNCTFEYEEI